MNCLQFEKALLLAVDHEVLGELRAAFASHLAECPPCQARLLQEHLVEQGILRAAEKIAAPHTLTRRLRDLAQQERRYEAQTNVLAPVALVIILLLAFFYSQDTKKNLTRSSAFSLSKQGGAIGEGCAHLSEILRASSPQRPRLLDARGGYGRVSLFAAEPQTQLETTKSSSPAGRGIFIDGYSQDGDATRTLRWRCGTCCFVLRSPCPSRNLVQFAQTVCDAHSGRKRPH